MLKQRILSTLRFFDLQDIPLTLLELHRFLLGDLDRISLSQDGAWELFADAPLGGKRSIAALEEILACIDTECVSEIENTLGYYHLLGRSEIVSARWQNYFFGIQRERRAKKFLPALRLLPFVRGVAIGGSQSLGQQKEKSDIDLFIVTEKGFMWLTRTFISAYFQVLGLRRHGKKIANRFCLNHYVAGPKIVERERNLYKAVEYARLRPVIYSQGVLAFLKLNQEWIWVYLPNFYIDDNFQAQSKIQKVLESLFKNPFGAALERFLGFFQRHKIRQDEFTFVLDDELSFHPHSQHRALLAKFFGQ